MDELSKKLIKIELELNDENVLPFGSMLAETWNDISGFFQGDVFSTKNSIIKILSIIKHSLLFILMNNKKIDSTKKIFLGKSGVTNHCNKLVDFIVEYDDQVTLFYGNYRSLNGEAKLFERLLMLFTSATLCLTKVRFIKKKMCQYSLDNYPIDRNVLFFNILYYFTCLKFLKRTGVEKVIVDYDRLNFIPLVLAAKKLNIPTISLQHGVIDPNYGFTPLIADEIWVWGQYWKKELINMGVKESSIKIVGSSIVDNFKEPKKNRTIMSVGIGPNPLGVKKVDELWKSLTFLLCETGFRVIVKFHPNMKKELYSSCFDKRCEIYDIRELKNEDFFDTVDLLLVGTSGLGYECVVSGTPVAVVREHSESKGNDAIMIDECNFLEIKDGDVLLANVIKYIENNYSSYIMEQQQFIKQHIYAFTGKNAQLEVIKRLDLIEL